MKQYVVRRATTNDATAVQSLTMRAYSKWVEVIGREPGPMKVNYDLAVRNHLIDLYEEKGDLLGLIEMIPFEDYLSIENLAVAPEAQGRGIGEILLANADLEAVSQGCSEIRLYTNLAFESNLLYYEKKGFQKFMREPIETGGFAIHMKKRVRDR